MPKPLQKEIEHYETVREELELEHFGKWVVVHDQDFVGTYETLEEAATFAVKTYGKGPYLIRKIGEPRVSPVPASLLFAG